MVISAKKVVAAAAAIGCMGAAHAGFVNRIIDFEQPVNASTTPFAPFAPLIGNGDEFYQSRMFIDALSNSALAQPGDLVGAIVDGSDPSTCFSILCPVNNRTKYYTALDDGYLAIGSLDMPTFTINGFDASFVGNGVDPINGVPGLIRLQGVRANGTSLTQTFNLTGADANGNLNFAHYNTTGAFRTTEFAYVFVFAFRCNASGSCSAFNTDQGDFALDNFNVNVIPEPGSWALAGLALAALAAVRRRRAL